MGQDHEIQLIVGLGNPGAQYQGSRHNIGFAVVEAVARRFAAGEWRPLPTHKEAKVDIGDRTVVLACPSTFMNRSGQAVNALMERFDLTPSEMLVVVDDIDLELGRLRVRRRGGAGTHNGLRDICDAVGDDYPRLRVGVGGTDAGVDLADFVLSAFPDGDIPMVEKVVENAVSALETVVSQGVAQAMNRFNGLVVENVSEQGSSVEKGWQLGGAKPVRNAQWTTVGEVIVVECPRPQGRGPRMWSEWFHWWMGPQRIRLDTVGSAIWLRVDGSTTLSEICDLLAEENPDDCEKLVARVDLFVRTLVSRGLLRIE